MEFKKSFGGREKYFPTKLKKDRTVGTEALIPDE